MPTLIVAGRFDRILLPRYQEFDSTRLHVQAAVDFAMADC